MKPTSHSLAPVFYMPLLGFILPLAGLIWFSNWSLVAWFFTIPMGFWIGMRMASGRWRLEFKADQNPRKTRWDSRPT